MPEQLTPDQPVVYDSLPPPQAGLDVQGVDAAIDWASRAAEYRALHVDPNIHAALSPDLARLTEEAEARAETASATTFMETVAARAEESTLLPEPISLEHQARHRADIAEVGLDEADMSPELEQKVGATLEVAKDMLDADGIVDPLQNDSEQTAEGANGALQTLKARMIERLASGECTDAESQTMLTDFAQAVKDLDMTGEPAVHSAAFTSLLAETLRFGDALKQAQQSGKEQFDWLIGEVQNKTTPEQFKTMYSPDNASYEDLQVLMNEMARLSPERATGMLSSAYKDDFARLHADMETALPWIKNISVHEIAIMAVRENRETPQSPVDEYSRITDRTEKYLTEICEFPVKMARDYMQASEARIRYKGERNAGYALELERALRLVGSNVDALGVPALQQLKASAGIVNLDRYTPTMLKNMEKFIDKDPAFLEQLRSGDVTLVTRTAYGDYNGFLDNLADTFDTRNTLNFEVDNDGDFLRIRKRCKERGIKPSVVVVGAHGDPNGMEYFRASGKRFIVTGLDSPESGGAQLRDATWLQDAQDFMQPSRGIDLEQAEPLVVLVSCNQATRKSRKDLSTAEALAGQMPSVEVAASAAEMYMPKRRLDGTVRAVVNHKDSRQEADSQIYKTVLSAWRQRNGLAPKTYKRRGDILRFTPSVSAASQTERV